MNVLARLRTWWLARDGAGETALGGDAPAWMASLVWHMAILFGMALLGSVAQQQRHAITVMSDATEPDEAPLAVSEEFTASDTPEETLGAAGFGDPDALLSSAPNVEGIATAPAEIGIPTEQPVVETTPIHIQQEIRMAAGPRFAETLSIKGAAGVGATGATGAVDRITQEILLSLEERKTLVVWLFDQSGSLERQRAEIIKRFDNIYEELGVIEASGNPAFKKHDSKPLVSAVMAFGEHISFLTPKPTDDVQEIKSAVGGMQTDPSGIELTFGAVCQAVERYQKFRVQEPRRNVMFVIFTDEVGDDEQELERTVALCRRYAIPVYCIGVPAPFGQRDASIKYIDPDPKYDQTPQWISVRQGPESYLPELVHIGSAEDEPMDSGFGPYSLTRLCYETGGIFFAVHPNRDDHKTVSRRETAVLSAQLSHFFDPEVMRNYRPDYVSIKDYKKLLKENKARECLVQAAQMSWVTPLERPQLVFPKRNDADLANRLTQAQHAAAVLEPKINSLYEMLRQGEKDRPRLTRPRWQAGYDLSMGRVLANKVRTEGYNVMLAKAKQGMRFEKSTSDTWLLAPSGNMNTGSVLEKQAEQARTYLERVVAEHPQTPWALLAEQELKRPLGWSWQETHTGINDPPKVAQGNNNNRPRPPADDKAKMIPRPEKRPPPKL